MPDVAKLKKKAAELELKKQFDKALAVYVEILDSYRGSDQEVDVALYNRVGDIYLKQGNVADAVDYYEKAVDHYIDTGFYNNAIALCNKILRSSPGRASIYYKLGKVSAHKGFKSDAKANYLEYADRMQKSGRLDEAFRALKEFADLCPDQDDIRLMLADQLVKAKRSDEAVEQLQLAYERYMQEGQSAEAGATVARMKQIDPTAQPRQPGAAPRPNTGDLIFLDLNDGAPPARPTPPLAPAQPPPKRTTKTIEFIDPDAAAPSPPKPAAPPPAAAPEPPLVEVVDFGAVPLDGLTQAPDFAPADDASQSGLLDGLVATGFGETTTLDSGSLLDIEATSFGEPAAPPDTSGLGGNLLDFEIAPGSEPAPPPAPRAQPPEAAQTDGEFELMDLELPSAPVSGRSAPRPSSPGLEALDLTPVDEAAPEPAPEPIIEYEEEALPVAARRSSTIMAVQSVEMLQAMVESEPDDHELRRRLAEAMLESGDRDGGLRELEAVMVGYERADNLEEASTIADEIVRLVPDSVRHLQKRVEYAFRRNERARLIEAYLELADALFRAGTVDKSRAIYQRVLDLAPDDIRAQAALETMPAAPPEAAPPPAAPKGRQTIQTVRQQEPAAPTVAATAPTPDDDFVNLGDWLRSEAVPKDTRMVVEEQEPTGDEAADFADMLRKFKQGIAENIDDEDHQSHYDLGVAYKEMGLLDEAIAEFQKALRAPTNRVPTYEALGAAFIEKEQYQMAATILSRGLSEKGMTDDQLVGVLYLLGRCAEERGMHDAAVEYYQRVFVVDIQFRDVGERLAAVEGARS